VVSQVKSSAKAATRSEVVSLILKYSNIIDMIRIEVSDVESERINEGCAVDGYVGWRISDENLNVKLMDVNQLLHRKTSV
jgi:hypothetical protein